MDPLWVDALNRWEIIAIILIAAAMILRNLFLSRAVRAVKDLGKETAAEIERLYRGRSLLGWMAILAATALMEWVVLFYGIAPALLTRREACLAAVILFTSGVYLHLESLHEASVFVLGNRIEDEKESV